MKRQDVYKAVDSERDYVEDLEKNDINSHVVENFPLGSAISAIKYNMNKAQEAWYSETQPNHEVSMEYIRKVAGICVKMGEKYGMPSRK